MAALLVGLVGLTGIGACEGDPAPTKPDPTVTVSAASTATDQGQIAVRVQLQVQVTAGVTALTDAVDASEARVEVCQDGACVERDVVPGRVEGTCETAVGLAQVEIASAWLEGSLAGVDFCVPTVTTSGTYQTRLRFDTAVSNPVTTTCASSGGFFGCTSD